MDLCFASAGRKTALHPSQHETVFQPRRIGAHLKSNHERKIPHGHIFVVLAIASISEGGERWGGGGKKKNTGNSCRFST